LAMWLTWSMTSTTCPGIAKHTVSVSFAYSVPVGRV
jgi:hypothetical protein